MGNDWIKKVEDQDSLIAALKTNVAEKQKLIDKVIEENTHLEAMNNALINAIILEKEEMKNGI
ncbi:MAG: hypothetical protein WC364_12300 [Eubacteriales bacterium]|jgi:uncharacterized coiled-coil protein SlyX